MNSSGPDYQKLYNVQDKVINLCHPALKHFYLTGGTALGRFYLNHRYSDDLDFFCDDVQDFSDKVAEIFRLLQTKYALDESLTVMYENFARIQILGEAPLKIELVNEKTFHWGEVKMTSNNIFVDNPANMLANKITAILGRDEPKDVMDIIALSRSYSFNWQEIYRNAFKKHIMNEHDVATRLSTFPINLLDNQPWLPQELVLSEVPNQLQTIVDDFLLARDNSLGKGKVAITEAKPMVER